MKLAERHESCITAPMEVRRFVTSCVLTAFVGRNNCHNFSICNRTVNISRVELTTRKRTQDVHILGLIQVFVITNTLVTCTQG
jgi:hypothetical protein